MSKKPYLMIQDLCKSFDGNQAVDHINLSINQNDFFTLLGGSGSGKTTLLRMIAGFEKPDKGRIILDGQDITDLPPHKRPVHMMFQSYALFPHMNVEQNIAFGLKQDKLPKAKIASKVKNMIKLLDLKGLETRMPNTLSGGQKQRVALARSIVKKPKLLLLDEPLAALDKKLREQTQFELVNLQESLGLPFILVTHDQDEAMSLSSHIAVMNQGRVEQIGTPNEIYEYPTNSFIANFIGNSNLIEGSIQSIKNGNVHIKAQHFQNEFILKSLTTPYPPGNNVTLSIRPEKIKMRKIIQPIEKKNEPNSVYGKVEEIAYHGDISHYLIRCKNKQIIRVTIANMIPRSEMLISWEDQVELSWNINAGIIVPK